MADEPVFRRVVEIMQRHGEFQGAEAGREMPCRLGNALHEIFPQLAGKGLELRLG
jgi:hypothetical protein